VRGRRPRPLDECAAGLSRVPEKGRSSAKSVELHVERDAKGDGRTYRLEFTASDGHGGKCSGTALAGVPHDKKHRWLDSGASFNFFAD
jgi:hypothetical protein